MKEILKRLQSPVVIAQLVSIIGGAIVLLRPEISFEVKTIVACVVAVMNVFAGINNPTDKENF